MSERDNPGVLGFRPCGAFLFGGGVSRGIVSAAVSEYITRAAFSLLASFRHHPLCVLRLEI